MKEKITWKGYARKDGGKGIRNHLLVLYTVECAKHVAHGIADGFDDTHVIGFTGCYDNAYAIRLMHAMATHPNVGAVLAVGLGCEYLRPSDFAMRAHYSGRESAWFYIQEEGGTAKSIFRGRNELDRMRKALVHTERIDMNLSDLVVGSECGGSDSTSGLAANPVVGGVFDRIVDAGGTALWEEIVEMVGLRNILVKRAATDKAAQEIGECYDKMEQYCKDVRQYSISPGNFAGGLTTIEEKSLGSYAKSGTKKVEGVIRVSEKPSHKGLWLLDSVPDPHYMQFGYTNPNDTEGLMDLISAGAHILYYTTGRGSVTGSPVSPTIKVTGNSHTYNNMKDDMDFDAGRVLTGELTMDQAADELLDLTIAVASGQKTKPEALGHREYMVMYKYQESKMDSVCRQENQNEK